MGRHPMGEGVDPNPRFLAEQAGRPVRAGDGHDRGEPARPAARHLTSERADAFALASQEKTAKAYADGKIQPDLVPVAIRDAGARLGAGHRDEAPRRAPHWRSWRR